MSAEKKKQSKTVKELHKQQIQNIVLAVVTLVALLALGWAWFVNNTRVSANGMEIAAESDRFQLATKGEQGIYDGNNTIVGLTKEIDGVVYYITSGEQPSISWMVGANNSINNETGNEFASLQPNTSGSISFSMLPLATDLQPDSVQYQLELIPYKKYDSGIDSNMDDLVTINDIQCVPMNETNPNYILLNGHILFFGEYDQANRYTKYLEPGVKFNNTYLIPDASSGTSLHYDYTLHWIWPGYFREYVDRGSSNIFSNNTESDADYQMFLDKFNNTPDHFFAGYSNSLDIPKVDALMSSADIEKCNNFYNNADELIGTNIPFFLLRLTATEG